MTALLTTRTAKYNKTVLALVCFFVGVFGVHRFIVGKRGSSIAMLMLTITSFGVVVSGIWALVDFVKILTGNFSDKDGNKITSWN